MSDNYEKMKEIIIDKLGVDENKITKEAKFCNTPDISIVLASTGLLFSKAASISAAEGP